MIKGEGISDAVGSQIMRGESRMGRATHVAAESAPCQGLITKLLAHFADKSVR